MTTVQHRAGTAPAGALAWWAGLGSSSCRVQALQSIGCTAEVWRYASPTMSRIKIAPVSALLNRDVLGLAESLRGYDDRSVALVVSAWVDDCLDQMLRAHLLTQGDLQKRLLGPSAPLGTSWAKATAGRLLGLIPPDLYADLGRIREIRNAFAHFRDPLSFRHRTIARHCRALEGASAYNLGGPPQSADTPRQRYLVTGIFAARHLLRCAGQARPPTEAEGASPYLMAVRRETKSAAIAYLLSQVSEAKPAHAARARGTPAPSRRVRASRASPRAPARG